MPNLGAPELLILLLIVVLIFGAAKLPTLARSMGQSLRIFKAETRSLREEDEKAKSETDRPAELTATEKDRLAELDRREAEIKAERDRLSGN